MDDIQKYIDENASRTIQIRAKEILRRNLILDFQYMSDENVISAVVLGNMPYNVNINLKGKNPIYAKCNCPYDWPGLCKHEVAVLMKFRNAYVDVTARKKRPGFIKNYENIDFPFLKNITDEFTLFTALDLTNRIKIRDFDGKAKMEFLVTDFGPSYFQKQRHVTVERTEKGLKLTCNCNDHDGFCMHKIGVLLYPAQKLDNTSFFLFLDEKYRMKKFRQIQEMYGLEKEADFNEHISLKFDEKRLYFTFDEKYAGLIPVIPGLIKETKDEVFQHIRTLQKEEDFLPEPVTDKPLAEGCFGVIFTFDQYSGKLISVNGMTARLNKKGDKPVSHFNYVYLTDYPDLPDNRKSILETAGKLSGLLSEDDALKPLPGILALLWTIIELLDDEIFAFIQYADTYYDAHKLKKKDLRRVKVSKHPFQIAFEVSAGEKFINMVPVFTANGETIGISPDKIHEHYLSEIMVLYNDTLYPAKDTTHVSIMEDLLRRPVKKMVVEHQDTFFKEFVKPYSEYFRIIFKNIKGWQIIQNDPHRMNKRLYISGLGQFVLFRPFVQYAEETEINILKSGMPLEFDEGRIRSINRNTDFEQEYYELLKSLHPKLSKQHPEEFFFLDIKDMMRDHWFLTAFEQLKAYDVEILGLNKLKNFKYNTRRAKISVNISSGEDWFDVQVEIAFGDITVSLRDVKKAVLKKDRFVELSDGSIGILPEEWLEKFSRMFRHGEVTGERLKISGRKFMIIDELFNNIDDEAIVNDLLEKKKKLRAFTRIQNVKVPAAIKAELRPYQKEGLNWLDFLHHFRWGGILADDMGLGKTLQILAFLARRKSKKANLIVVPTTLIFNWESEIDKFYPTLKVLFHYGVNRKKNFREFDRYDLVITSYGVVVNDIKWMKEYAFNYVILDESQAIKNPVSLRFKAVSLLKAKNRITLTGTPVENNTFDLYAQMHFVNPGLLGTARSFKEAFSIPIDKNSDRQRAEELRKLINPFIIRRTKEQVAKELPPKTEEVLYCHMEKEQRRVYDAYRNKYRNMLLGKIDKNGLEKSKIYVLEGLMKLRQICDSPGLLSDEAHYGGASVKIEELIRNIREKTGNHKIVVFSQFVTMLGLIRERLNDLAISYEYLDGSSSKNARKQSVEHFQSDDDCRVFLISLKAGGTGLNLTAADYVFLVDPWWNPAVEEQAIDRCYRIGQDKKVFAYRMICKDTIEEKIMSYKERKRAVAADIIQAEESFMKQLTTEDIKGLFS